MAARRKTGAGGGGDRKRPLGAPDGALRTWYENRILRAARARLQSGFQRGSREELGAVGDILLELGGDPNALLLDAAVAALYARCEERLSAAGRRPDDENRHRKKLGYLAVRILVEMSEAAAGTRYLPAEDRLEEIALAAAKEKTRQFIAWQREEFGEIEIKGAELSARATQEAELAREWLARRPDVAKALLEHHPGWDPVAPWQHEEAAIELLRLVDPSEKWFAVPRDVGSLDLVRRKVAEHVTRQRKRLKATDEALRTELKGNSGE